MAKINVQRALCERYNCTVDELLNGAGDEGFVVELKFVDSLEGVDEAMQVNGVSLIIEPSGALGIAVRFTGLDSESEVDKRLAEVKKKLMFGIEHRDELMEKGK